MAEVIVDSKDLEECGIANEDKGEFLDDCEEVEEFVVEFQDPIGFGIGCKNLDASEVTGRFKVRIQRCSGRSGMGRQN